MTQYKAMPSLTVGSLFSGIGGLDLGFERAGFQIKWQVEIDEYCRRVLAKHWPDVPKYEDVRDVGAHNLERVDVIVGGFPCQPHSVAGKGLGERDERWLWPEFARLIGELRPRYAIVENVPGLVPRGLTTILADLTNCFYDAEGMPLAAAAFGAPHIRERLFIVAYPQSREDSGLQQRLVFPDTRRGFSGATSPNTNSINRHEGLGDFTFWAQSLSPSKESNGDGSWIQAARRFTRMDDGLSSRAYRHRAKGLGNAVVPQVAEYVARCVLAHAQAIEQQLSLISATGVTSGLQDISGERGGNGGQ